MFVGLIEKNRWIWYNKVGIFIMIFVPFVLKFQKQTIISKK